jgi:hypothetical protein
MKQYKIKSLIVVFLGVVILLVGEATVKERYGKQKVVYHINYDDPDAQIGALRNVQNHINAVGKENLDFKSVMHGDRLSLLLEPDALANTKLKRGNATNELQVAQYLPYLHHIDRLRNGFFYLVVYWHILETECLGL